MKLICWLVEGHFYIASIVELMVLISDACNFDIG